VYWSIFAKTMVFFEAPPKAPLDARELEILWSDEANENLSNFLENRSLRITITFGMKSK